MAPPPLKTSAEYREQLLSAPSDIVLHAKGDRFLVVHRLLFHWTLQEYRFPDAECYEDRWCFGARETALAAVAEWQARGFDGEPIGWHRHPRTGRRRPGGDPAGEYVEW